MNGQHSLGLRSCGILPLDSPSHAVYSRGMDGLRPLDQFLEDKRQLAKPSGFEPHWMPGFLFPFQRDLTRWALSFGRGLLLADCGLGKTPIALTWARNVNMETNGRVLILTPLAVARQFEREGEKFDIPCAVSRDGKPQGDITVANYEILEKFDSSDYQGVVCDESSCIKNFSGKRRAQVTEFLRTIPYRLLDTATAAPNDYVELGTSAEALGHLGYMDMLNYFFINDENSLHPTALGARWRFKKAAETPFWRWVCSWARACRKPSDLGYDDDGFILPELTVNHRIVENTNPPPGYLPGIHVEAVTLSEQREERKANLRERCELAAELATHSEPVVLWADYNAETELLAEMIDDAVEVAGSMTAEQKEERLIAFQDGEIRCLVTKPKIGAWGLNWQHCHRTIFFVSHSFEQYYQAVRRFWRFGQESEVEVDIIATPGERRVLRNLERKREQSERMFDSLVKHMNDPNHLRPQIESEDDVEVPPWLT